MHSLEYTMKLFGELLEKRNVDKDLVNLAHNISSTSHFSYVPVSEKDEESMRIIADNIEVILK